MSRYIDADKLAKKVLEVWETLEKQGINCDLLADIVPPLVVTTPTENVKPIVYCKDCKFQDDIKGCIRLNIFVDKNTFYCEYAMRKESEEEE